MPRAVRADGAVAAVWAVWAVRVVRAKWAVLMVPSKTSVTMEQQYYRCGGVDKVKCNIQYNV